MCKVDHSIKVALCNPKPFSWPYRVANNCGQCCFVRVI